MKTTMIAATIALGLTAGVALADQPMVLTNAQLDQVTASGTAAKITLRRGLTHDEDFSFTPDTSDQVTVSFGVAEPEDLLELTVQTGGTQTRFRGVRVWDIRDLDNPVR
jgi:hypothetical protein